jgi:hypothetical protein
MLHENIGKARLLSVFGLHVWTPFLVRGDVPSDVTISNIKILSGITQVCMRTSPNDVHARDMRCAVKAFSLCAEHVFQERYAATEAALLENSVYSCHAQTDLPAHVGSRPSPDLRLQEEASPTTERMENSINVLSSTPTNSRT